MDTNNPNTPPSAREIEELRRVVFPDLGTDHVEEIIIFCRHRGFDPWANHVAAEVRPTGDGDKVRLVIMVRIDAMRAKAHATGKYAGCSLDKPEYDKDGNLVSSAVTVYRSVGRKLRKFRARAYLELYCPGGRAPSPMWEAGKGRIQQLGRCAKALALRDAFSELAGCYSPEEMDQSFPRAGGGAGGGEAPAPPRRPPLHEDLPTTLAQLRVRLVQYGFEDEADQDKLIAGFRSRWRAEQDNSQTFYVNVFKAVRQNPEEYGGRRPEAA